MDSSLCFLQKFKVCEKSGEKHLLEFSENSEKALTLTFNRCNITSTPKGEG